MLGKKNKNKRFQEIVLSVLAIILLFAGVPITAYFIYDLERNLDGGNQWDDFEEDGLQNVTLGYGGGDYSVPLLEWQFNNIFDVGDFCYTEHNSMILWDYDNESMDYVVMAPTLTQGSYNELWHILMFFTNMTLDSMINNDINMCSFKTDSPKPINFGLMVHEVTDGTVDILKNVSMLVEDDGERVGNHTIYFNWTALDLLSLKAERGGSAIISIWISAVDEEGFLTGDLIGFDVGFNPVDDDNLTQFTILKIGAGVIAVVYGLTTLACTGLWNPLSKNDPGVVDRGLSWISKRFKKKKKKGG